ncbi:uncharacterized protein LTHEOB_12792 [Lasiodiplodia theobromae]|uniref:uncharacterized protein n=1 Tax=Lasiodiplodia theobromae TaxID=45133 RepID=UPI0015C2E33B|nr:uncharacterized protein LTHEOB_12792 [Lasiodiplodia theobromae]KAF4535103.1 hypothetical protein LTHEOB_12792 [Lasiodiplodia theobromae]
MLQRSISQILSRRPWEPDKCIHWAITTFLLHSTPIHFSRTKRSDFFASAKFSSIVITTFLHDIITTILSFTYLSSLRNEKRKEGHLLRNHLLGGCPFQHHTTLRRRGGESTTHRRESIPFAVFLALLSLLLADFSSVAAQGGANPFLATAGPGPAASLHGAGASNSRSSIPLSQHGVREHTGWQGNMVDNLDRALARLANLARDDHEQNRSMSVEEHYTRRLDRAIERQRTHYTYLQRAKSTITTLLIHRPKLRSLLEAIASEVLHNNKEVVEIVAELLAEMGKELPLRSHNH